MVVCAVRYELVSLLFGQYQGDFQKKQRAGAQKCQKALRHGHFINISRFDIREKQGAAFRQEHGALSTEQRAGLHDVVG